MSENWNARTELLIGKSGIEILKNKHVLVVGVGGVGSTAAEQLCRAGIGKLTIVDGDVVHNSNRNRQLLALNSTEGKRKTEVLSERLKDINPEIIIEEFPEYIKDERMVEILKNSRYDYVIDAIDTLSPKIYLLYHCINLGLPVVSSMGAGGKFDPTMIAVADLQESYQCRLAYYIRKRLRKLGIENGIVAVFSTEKVDKSAVELCLTEEPNKKSQVGTISYMPPAFGNACASVVIRHFLFGDFGLNSQNNDS